VLGSSLRALPSTQQLQTYYRGKHSDPDDIEPRPRINQQQARGDKQQSFDVRRFVKQPAFGRRGERD
jgi:hypothetical protein